jgi:hypothetical protein
MFGYELKSVFDKSLGHFGSLALLSVTLGLFERAPTTTG